MKLRPSLLFAATLLTLVCSETVEGGVASRVEAPFQSFAGDWMALLPPWTRYDHSDLGGRIDFRVTPRGMVSGSVRLGSVRYAWRDALIEEAADPLGQALLEIVLSPGDPEQEIRIPLTLTGDLVEGRLGGAFGLEVTGWRRVWSHRGSSQRNASNYTGYHVFKLPIDHHLNWPTDVGTGFGSLVVGLDGMVQCVGQAGDGQFFTSSAPLGPDGQLAIFASLYGGQGSLCGKAEMATDANHSIWSSYEGRSIAWNKRANERQVRTYPEGFSYWINMEGAKHIRPSDWSELLGGTNGIDAVVSVDSGSPQIPLRLNPRSVGLASTDLPRLAHFRLNPQTGFFNGAMLREEDGRQRLFSIAGVFVGGSGEGFVRIPPLTWGAPEPTIHGAIEILPVR